MSDLGALCAILAFFCLALMGIIIALAVNEEQSRKALKVGDKAPQSLLDHKPEDGPLGAFITICPECNRIDNIWHP